MFCSKCGKKYADGVEFCSNCGFKIGTQNIEEEKKENKDIIITEDESMQNTIGNIKKVIDAIIVRKGKGEPLLIINIKKKLVLKGINPAKYTYKTIDDPNVLIRLRDLINDLGIKVK